jgi:Integrase core domain
MIGTWKQALFIMQPETVLGFHRERFRLFWKHTSKADSRQPKLSLETMALIKEIVKKNRRLPSGAHPRRVAQAGYWTAQQLREATPYGHTPNYLMRDHESKFGPCFARVAVTSGIEILKTPYHAPRANAICERFLGSVRRECLDDVLILHEKQLHRVLRAYLDYFNEARPPQGIQQRVPQGEVCSVPSDQRGDRNISVPVLGDLHYEYRRVA